MRQLAIVLADTKNTPFVRKAAGLQIKNALSAREQALFDQKKHRCVWRSCSGFFVQILNLVIRWFSIPDEVRQSVKKCVLQTLGTEVRPSVAAQCIAALACVELPVNVRSIFCSSANLYIFNRDFVLTNNFFDIYFSLNWCEMSFKILVLTSLLRIWISRISCRVLHSYNFLFFGPLSVFL